MKVNEFLNEVLAAAKAAGIDPAEVYYHGGDSFNVSALDGEISDYKVASSCGGVPARHVWRQDGQRVHRGV